MVQRYNDGYSDTVDYKALQGTRKTELTNTHLLFEQIQMNGTFMNYIYEQIWMSDCILIMEKTK